MSTPTRQEVLARIKALVGEGRIVRWADASTLRGTFEGADWMIDVFDVPAGEGFELGRRIGSYRRELNRQYRIDLIVVPHTPEATDRHYPWVRAEAGETTDTVPPIEARFIMGRALPFTRPRPSASFVFGVQT